MKFGELSVMDPFGKPNILPTYCCGHCSDVVVMRPDRVRARRHCHSCGKMICERKQICNIACTPIHELARDHFEGSGSHGKLAKAILSGCETVEQGHQQGLIIT